MRRIRAIGGKGGDGCISFLRLWVNDNAGPDGGDGGHGGHVLIQVKQLYLGLFIFIWAIP